MPPKIKGSRVTHEDISDKVLGSLRRADKASDERTEAHERRIRAIKKGDRGAEARARVDVARARTKGKEAMKDFGESLDTQKKFMKIQRRHSAKEQRESNIEYYKKSKKK